MKRRILHYGEEPLRQESKPVTTIDDDLRALVKDMFETMYQAHGVGLAAPQVGVNLRLFLIDTGNAPMVFINPEIVKTSGKEICEEGCLSFPGLREKVERPARVIARATDLEGKEFEVQADGLLARAIQHELDHLDGVLFIDRISKARRIQLKRDLERIAAGESLEPDDDADQADEEA
ncbi:MAG: Peptide deformylase [Candidatus Ozemobacter sibiricus]|jgi:peptide deformylase|uniref:Peptide deformylase n=1 Tax=Candidatus Ozemobacter sibiricus TaxID=2268124 RepID=A0A367ZPD7_9BACT|nr:MAG: Peptide deformylase [Candidatus Ozemobacter sibiricus]